MDGQWVLPLVNAFIAGSSFPCAIAWLNGMMFITLSVSGAVGILTLRNALTFKILITAAITIVLAQVLFCLAFIWCNQSYCLLVLW